MHRVATHGNNAFYKIFVRFPVTGTVSFVAQKDFYGRYMEKQASRDPREELPSKGYTVVNDKEELIKVLESVIGKGKNIDITYEEPDDEKDLS